MRVFYKLDDFEANALDLQTANGKEYVCILQQAIKLHHAMYLASCDAADLAVYPAANSKIDDDDKVPCLGPLEPVPESEATAPLIVVSVSPNLLKAQNHATATSPQINEHLQQFFAAHCAGNCAYKNDDKGCPLCYKILYYAFSGFDEHHGDLDQDTIVKPLEEVCKEQIGNYEKVKVPVPNIVDLLSAVPSKSLESIVKCTDPTERIVGRYSLFFSSLFADVCLARSNRSQLEGYFDGFYINLLRQCLDLAGFQCFQREEKLRESTSTSRKVDLLAEFDTRPILMLESAMNGGKDKVEQDRGKVAMEIYRVWESPAHCHKVPPIGVLVYSDNHPGIVMTCVFEVYTMIQHTNTQACLVQLDRFKAPVCKTDVTDLAFETACAGIQRIVEACKAIRDIPLTRDIAREERKRKSVSATTTAPEAPTASADDSNRRYVPGGRPFRRGGQNQSDTPAKQTKTTNKNNCCCAKYELHDKMLLAKTGWSEIAVAVERATGHRFVRKSERVDWKEHDESIDWNPFDTEVAIFLKISLAPTFCLRDTLVKPVDVCVSDRTIYMEELHDVDWAYVRSNPKIALTACIDLLQAVTTLHFLNIAHCDIKHNAVMVRRHEDRESCCLHVPDCGPANHGGDRFVLCDFNLCVVNADELNPEYVPFGTAGWSLKSQRFPVAPAKDHDRFSMGLLLAWSCSTEVNEIVESYDECIWSKSLTRLVEEASRDKDEIRHTILVNALALCRLDISVEDAARSLCDKRDQLRTFHGKRTGVAQPLDRVPLATIGYGTCRM